MASHKHAQLIIELGKDCLISDKAYLAWQYYDRCSIPEAWKTLNSIPVFYEGTDYRRHPNADWILRVLNGEKVEIKTLSHGWQLVDCIETFKYMPNEVEFRLKLKTIRIGEFEVPEPVRESLKYETKYYCLYYFSGDGYIERFWANHHIDNNLLANGAIHLTEEAAKAHVEAWRSLMKKEGE